jgi:hypothetical protein
VLALALSENIEEQVQVSVDGGKTFGETIKIEMQKLLTSYKSKKL